MKFWWSATQANSQHDSLKNKWKSFKNESIQATFQRASDGFSSVFFSPPASESAKCRALPGHYYDGLLRKCMMCAEVCGRHPAECWPHCHSESQLKYSKHSVMLSASASWFIKKKRFWEYRTIRMREFQRRWALLQNKLIKRGKQTNFETLQLNHVQNSSDIPQVPWTHKALHPGIPFLDGRRLKFLSFTDVIVCILKESLLRRSFFCSSTASLCLEGGGGRRPGRLHPPALPPSGCKLGPAVFQPVAGLGCLSEKSKDSSCQLPIQGGQPRPGVCGTALPGREPPRSALRRYPRASQRDQGFQFRSDCVYSFPDFAGNSCQPTSYSLSEDASPTETCVCVHCFPDLTALGQGHDRPLRVPFSIYPCPVIHKAHVQNGGPVQPEGAAPTTEGDAREQEAVVG